MKTTKTKIEWSWCFADSYIDHFRGMPVLMEDNEFRRIFNEMQDYISSKMATPTEDDITDIYVIFEQVETVQPASREKCLVGVD